MVVIKTVMLIHLNFLIRIQKLQVPEQVDTVKSQVSCTTHIAYANEDIWAFVTVEGVITPR